jgi:hypothetical protein
MGNARYRSPSAMPPPEGGAAAASRLEPAALDLPPLGQSVFRWEQGARRRKWARKVHFDFTAFRCVKLVARFDELDDTVGGVRVSMRRCVENSRATIKERFDSLSPTTGPRAESHRLLEVGGVM